jgi:hypothetical protein
MSLLRVDFAELYARHLCRHSQFGINVAHLAALFGMWYGVYGIIYSLVRGRTELGPLPEWLPVALAAAYLALVARNAPVRVCVATAVFLAIFLAALFWLPELPIWVYVVMIPMCYELQALSHKVFTVGTDMTEFNKKYPKGVVLFVVLLIYEVPLVLNYLLFDRKSWAA